MHPAEEHICSRNAGVMRTFKENPLCVHRGSTSRGAAPWLLCCLLAVPHSCWVWQQTLDSLPPSSVQPPPGTILLHDKHLSHPLTTNLLWLVLNGLHATQRIQQHLCLHGLQEGKMHLPRLSSPCHPDSNSEGKWKNEGKKTTQKYKKTKQNKNLTPLGKNV